MPKNWNAVKGRRVGCMIHYDASRSDRGAVAWLRSKDCRVSYHLLVTDDGEAHAIAPLTARAWHAGVCLPSEPRLQYTDANSAFYGFAIAATDGDTVTPAQWATVVRLVRECFAREKWPLTDSWRVVGHDTEAWPRGRKQDPTGSNPAKPVLSVAAVREALADAA